MAVGVWVQELEVISNQARHLTALMELFSSPLSLLAEQALEMNPSVPNTSFATPQKENNDADKRTQASDAVEEKSKSADVVYPPGTVFIEVMGLHVAKGDYNTWTDPLLMQECKRRNIRGFSRGRKDTRIGMLFAWDANFKIMENENFVLDTPPTS